jgi:hypothetical protein
MLNQVQGSPFQFISGKPSSEFFVFGMLLKMLLSHFSDKINMNLINKNFFR